jgi:hypothetical protein
VGYFKGRTRITILLCKIEKTKEKSQISKKFSNEFRCFEFEGIGSIMLTRTLILLLHSGAIFVLFLF